MRESVSPALLLYMNLGQLILVAAYLFGCFVSFWMMRIEIEAENEPYTKGDRAIGIIISILSWFSVFIVLFKSWIDKISETGYWKQPVEPIDKTSK